MSGDRGADVCIVGGGFTGLWTAYYLKRALPELDVVVLEREFAGFGASGRNGGWLYAGFNWSREAMVRSHGREAVIELQRAMQTTVDEVIEVCARERIDADIVKHGVLRVARNEAQARRQREHVAYERSWDLATKDLLELDSQGLAERVRIDKAIGGTWNPYGARVQPAQLVRGLADAVERLGVPIYEDTAVREIAPGVARSDRGSVRASYVLSCLEGFTAGIRGHRRKWLPLNSAMVVTEPLTEAAWEQIGWEGVELIGDYAHAYIYAQRTSDGRIALGGRGVPYRYGSRIDHDGHTQRRTIAQLTRTLRDMFPAATATPIEHAWCGVLAVPRDWSPVAALDHDTGLGLAGGYVGNGVATANLAGRTLRDLVLGETTALSGLSWVGRTARSWEPEPLRWIGAHTVYALYRAADRREARGLSRTSRLAKLADRLAGRSAQPESPARHSSITT
ncbi:MAG TPA: FAD-binding oxidoreductase [Solirubrobacteraceae bacterium]|nr:FAD-binding oxidoreductase [Solirubrobacteraceae bacterium]